MVYTICSFIFMVRRPPRSQRPDTLLPSPTRFRSESTRKTLGRLDGAFALAIIFAGEDDLMIGARQGSPLALGYGDGEMYLGSDALALAPLTPRLSYLEEGDWVVLNGRGAQVYDADGEPVEREIRETALSGAMIGKGNYPHFMLKEIYEQPTVVGDTLRALFTPNTRRMQLTELPVDLAPVPRVTVSACGTRFPAGHGLTSQQA